MQIACIADTHCTVPEMDSGSLFPRQLATLSQEAAERLYAEMREEIQRAYSVSLEWLKNNGPWDSLVHLGDVTGGYGEQGCHHPSAQRLAREVVADLCGLAPKVRFVLGNHDTGYSHPGSLPGSGISLASITFCREIFGDLFWADEEQGLLSVGICSPIAEYNGPDPEILSFKQRQAEFLEDVLSTHKGSWMLYVHDPFTLKHLAKEIKGHTNQLQRVVRGDFHDPRKWKLLEAIPWASGSILSRQVALKCLRKSAFCPSTAPLWWQGYGLLVLSGDKEKIKAQEIALNRPTESKDLPTSSFWRCLWWMIRRRSKLF